MRDPINARSATLSGGAEGPGLPRATRWGYGVRARAAWRVGVLAPCRLMSDTPRSPAPRVGAALLGPTFARRAAVYVAEEVLQGLEGQAGPGATGADRSASPEGAGGAGTRARATLDRLTVAWLRDLFARVPSPGPLWTQAEDRLWHERVLVPALGGGHLDAGSQTLGLIERQAEYARARRSAQRTLELLVLWSHAPHMPEDWRALAWNELVHGPLSGTPGGASAITTFVRRHPTPAVLLDSYGPRRPEEREEVLWAFLDNPHLSAERGEHRRVLVSLQRAARTVVVRLTDDPPSSSTTAPSTLPVERFGTGAVLEAWIAFIAGTADRDRPGQTVWGPLLTALLQRAIDQRLQLSTATLTQLLLHPDRQLRVLALREAGAAAVARVIGRGEPPLPAQSPPAPMPPPPTARRQT